MKRKICLISALSMLALFGCSAKSDAVQENTAEETTPAIQNVQDMETTIVLKNRQDDDIEEVERTGIYSGDVVDEILSGQGEFSSENTDGTSWIYTGEFADNTFNGQGKIVFDSNGSYWQGTFTDGLYTPTIEEFLLYILPQGLDSQDSFTYSQEDIDFIKTNAKYFTASQEELDSDGYKALIDTNIADKDLMDSAVDYGGSLATIDYFNVCDILETNLYGVTYSSVLTKDDNDNFFMLFYMGSVDLEEGDPIIFDCLPVTNGSFTSTDGNVYYDTLVIATQIGLDENR
jgi:hypothetical protein